MFVFLLVNRLSRQEQWVSIRLKAANDEWWWSTNSPEEWYGAGLSKGQYAYNTFGKRVAEIQSVENYDVGGPRRLIYANLKILTTYNKNTHTYTFNYQTLQIGKPLDFTFNQNNLHGLVTYIGDNMIPYHDANLEVKLLGILPWEATSYTKGAQMRDVNGNIIGTIERVDVTDTLVSTITDNNGRLFILPTLDNTRKDVTLRLTLKTYVSNRVQYFIDGTAIKIGNHIWLEFERTAVKDAIISNIY